MKNLKIKNTTGLTLNGNQISGNTFSVKDYIKSYLGGKWNGELKVWTIDTDKLNNLLNSRGACVSIDEIENVAMVTKNTNGICPKCHTYCDGDCQSH